MSHTRRRLALQASIARSHAAEFEARLELARLLQADAQVRIDRLAAAGTQKELERAFRVNALACPTKV